MHPELPFFVCLMINFNPSSKLMREKKTVQRETEKLWRSKKNHKMWKKNSNFSPIFGKKEEKQQKRKKCPFFGREGKIFPLGKLNDFRVIARLPDCLSQNVYGTF